MNMQFISSISAPFIAAVASVYIASTGTTSDIRVLQEQVKQLQISVDKMSAKLYK